MTAITRSITAAHLIGSDKYPRAERLTFDPDKAIEHDVARAHLRVMYPHGYVISIHPNERGPKGGWGAARYYKEGQAFLFGKEFRYWFIATPAREGSASVEKEHREMDEALRRVDEWRGD